MQINLWQMLTAQLQVQTSMLPLLQIYLWQCLQRPCKAKHALCLCWFSFFLEQEHFEHADHWLLQHEIQVKPIESATEKMKHRWRPQAARNKHTCKISNLLNQDKQIDNSEMAYGLKYECPYTTYCKRIVTKRYGANWKTCPKQTKL